MSIPPTTTPPQPPTTLSALRKGVIVNMINLNSTNRANIQVPITAATSWFVARVAPDGSLINTNIADEQALVSQTHAGGGKVDFSLGGGTQNAADLATAVNINTTAFINAIINHLKTIGADGVKLDFEWLGDIISGSQMLNFIIRLRQELDAAAPGGARRHYITLDVAPGEIGNTRWSTLGQQEPYIDAICVMCYDTNTHPDAALIESLVDSPDYPWPSKMNGKKSKVFPGMAITGLRPPTIAWYEDTTVAEWAQVCNWAAANGYGGVMVWDHVYMTAAHWSAVASAFGI